MAVDVALVAELVRWTAFALMAGTTILLFVTHRRSRATVFTDVALKAAALVVTVLYLHYLGDNARSFRGVDPEVFTLAVNGVLLLMAIGFVVVSISLWRFTTRTDGAVIVSPEFLVGLRSRMGAMYGATSASFVSYAVGKESAQKAVARMVDARYVTPAQMWRRLPHWFRLMGYGRLAYEGAPGAGDELRVTVRDTFEARHPDPKQPHAGCDLTRGYLAGLGQALRSGTDCEVEETACSCRTGGDACAFTLRWFPPLQADVKVVLQERARPGG